MKKQSVWLRQKALESNQSPEECLIEMINIKMLSVGIKKKENITVSRSEHRTPQHLQDIQDFLDKLKR